MQRLLQLLDLPLPLPLASIRNRRTFLYVANLVDAIGVGLEHAAASRRTFCLGDPEDMGTSDLLKRLAAAGNRRLCLFPFPVMGLRAFARVGGWLARCAGLRISLDGGAIEKLCGSLPVDSGLFRRECGWKPPFTVEEGLRTLFSAPRAPIPSVS
jgi:nucleoside-diphosphate-sugar epimerase